MNYIYFNKNVIIYFERPTYFSNDFKNHLNDDMYL